MAIADDLLAITRAGLRSVPYVFGTERGSGVFLIEEMPVIDELGGSILKRVQVLRVPVAQLASATIGDAITVDSVAYHVRDNQLTGGGELREVLVA